MRNLCVNFNHCVTTTTHLARSVSPAMFAAHVASVQTAVDSELAFLADYQEPVEGWGRERVGTLPTAATDQAALPVRMGGMGIKVMGLADARIAAMVFITKTRVAQSSALVVVCAPSRR
jgi:hypothetical protein